MPDFGILDRSGNDSNGNASIIVARLVLPSIGTVASRRSRKHWVRSKRGQ
jgi:hypothetical protein